MKFRILTAVAVVASLFIATVASAAPQSFKLDPNHTFAVFRVNHLGYSTMIGAFNEISGQLTLDQDQLDNSTVEITLNTTSVDTNHQKRDDHLRSPDFFNAVEFPEMTFKSTSVKTTGDNTMEIAGDLTLLGETKPVTLEAVLNKVAEHPIPSYNGVVVAGFSASTSLKRSDFGMNYALEGIGDQIDILLEAEFHAE
jgi:polyisoprenoid-binding protein YceI